MPITLGWVLFTISTSVRCVVSVLIIYFGFRFYQSRHCQALQKRYPPLVYSACFLTVLFLVLSRTFYDLAFIYDHHHSYYVWGTVFYVFSIHGEVLVIITRAWIVYFNIKFTEQMQNLKWKVHIDPSQASIDSFWFIKHNKNLGSYRFIAVCVFIFYLMEATLLLLLWLLSPFSVVFNIVDSVLFITEVITALVIWFKISDFYDIFGMKNELKYMLYCGGIALATYIFYIPVKMVLPDNIWFYFIVWIVGSLCIAMATIICSSYIYSSKHKYLLSQDVTNHLNEDQNKFNLTDTLKHDELIGEFLMHLSVEFSIELLLSYIEFRQFKILMSRDEAFMNTDLPNDHIVSQKVPQSYIVFEKHKHVAMGKDRYSAIAKDLFDKYISYSAELTVNLSYLERHAIETAIHSTKLDDHELYTLFDQCIDTLFLLMFYSHQRFVKTERFTVLKQDKH
eukprot:15483_1